MLSKPRSKVSDFIGEVEHAPISPSKFPIITICGRFEGKKGKVDTNSPAYKGTVLHRIAELFLTYKVREANELIFLAKKENIITGDDFNNLQGYINFVNENSLNKELIVEPRLDIFKNGKLQTFGYADIVIIDKNRAIIVDLKTGLNLKSYKKQLAIYAIGVFQRYPVDEIKAFAYWSSMNGAVQEYEFTREYCEQVLDDGLANVAFGDYVRNDYCQYCVNKSCELMTKDLELMTKKRDEFESLPQNLKSSEYRDQLIANLAVLTDNPADQTAISFVKSADADLKYIYQSSKNIKKYFDGVNASIKKCMSEGVQLNSFYFKDKKRAGKIENANKVFDGLNISNDRFLSCVDVNLTKLANVLEIEEIETFAGDIDISQFFGKKGKLLKTKRKEALEFILNKKHLISNATFTKEVKLRD